MSGGERQLADKVHAVNFGGISTLFIKLENDNRFVRVILKSEYCVTYAVLAFLLVSKIWTAIGISFS